MVVNGEDTNEYEVRKEVLFIRGDRLDLVVDIGNLLGDHEMAGIRLLMLYFERLGRPHVRSGHFPALPFVRILWWGTRTKRLEQLSSILDSLNAGGVRHGQRR